MKLILGLLLLLFASNDLLAQERWIKLDSIGERQLMAVQFIDLNKGYVVARDGAFYTTVNGGKDWTESFVDAGHPLARVDARDMWFHDSLTGVVVGSLDTSSGLVAEWEAALFWTYDGGKTWDAEIFDERGAIQFVQFLDRKFGFFVTTATDGQGRSQFYSTDAGGFRAELWTKKTNFPSPERARGMALIDNVDAIVSGDDEFVIPSNLYLTHSGGDTWDTYAGDQGGSGVSLDGLHWTPDGLLGTSGSRIMHSIDSGRNWFIVASAAGGAFFHKFAFVSDNVGFAVPMFGPIMRTTNGGFAWTAMELPEHTMIMDVWPIEVDLAYAVSASGKIYKLTTASWVDREADLAPLSVFPNPSYGSVTVRAQMPGSGAVLDLLGRVVERFTLADEGSVKLQLDHLPPGPYTIVVNGVTTRMILTGR